MVEVLPDNILLQIFQHLNYECLCLGVRMTCQRWHSLSHDGDLWRTVSIPEHFDNHRVLILMKQISYHVEEFDCSKCEDLTQELFYQLAELGLPRLRILAVPIVGCFTDTAVFECLGKSASELIELENVACTLSDPIQPLKCQAFFPKLKVIHDKPVSTYGRIRKLIAPLNASEKKAEWAHDLKDLAEKCPDVLSYRCRRGFEYLDDEGLEFVAKILPELRFLELHYTSITDEGLVHFFKYSKGDMREIILDKPGDISDKGLEIIADHCENIETLKITRCIQVTSKGISYVVSKCHKLRELHLNNTIYAFDETTSKQCDIDNTCLQDVGSNCPNLALFRVFYSNVISTQGLFGLVHCRYLQGLMFYDCPAINDLCLHALVNLPFLHALVLVGCNGITPAGVTDLILLAPCLYRLTLFVDVSSDESFFQDMTNLAEKIFDQLDEGFLPSVLKKLTLKGVGGSFIQLLTVLCPSLHTLDIRESCVMTLASIKSVVRLCENLEVLDVQSLACLDDSFLDTLCEYGGNLSKIALGATVGKFSNESLVTFLASCPSLTSVSMDTHGTHIDENLLVFTSKKFHGGYTYLFVDTDCRGENPSIPHRFIELHFTAIKYLESITACSQLPP